MGTSQTEQLATLLQEPLPLSESSYLSQSLLPEEVSQLYQECFQLMMPFNNFLIDQTPEHSPMSQEKPFKGSQSQISNKGSEIPSKPIPF